MAASYITRAPWNPERPETLVVCCSDGRYHGPIEEFVHAQVSEKPDLFAVPGGPAAIDPWASSFDHGRVFETSLALLFASHDLRSAWLIAHHGCAFYRHRHAELTDAALRDKQVTDLRRARSLLLERHPRLEVRLVYATLHPVDAVNAAVPEGDHVHFEEIAAE